jgi:hypothetical protein
MTVDQERAHRAHEMAVAATAAKRQYIVTIKLPRMKDHDPSNKKTGPCPVSHAPCDDVTGQHHSFLFETERDIDYVRANWDITYHVTRVEEVG